MNESENRDDWRCHGWDDEVRGKLAHARTLTFRQRLEWLEAMGDLVDHLQRDPEWRRRNARVEGRAVVVREDPPRALGAD